MMIRNIRIEYNTHIISVPDNPVIPFIQGDGVGPEIWRVARSVLDAAVKHAYRGTKEIAWAEVYAGDTAYQLYGQWLPMETIEAIRSYKVAIKGPLTTPVGGGIRSINVLLRKTLGLYAGVRPIRYIGGVPSPVVKPEQVDIVLFRENLEDVYTGIEWPGKSVEALEIIRLINNRGGFFIDEDSGIGIKPMSPNNSKNLIRRAIRYAIDNHRASVTLVHKGNIMKYTEGAFKEWGYEVARDEFPGVVITERELSARNHSRQPEGTVVLKDRIADDMFQQVLLNPSQFDVIATPNLNGDYLSDAIAAQVGGLGMAPGANIGDEAAVFESVHGTFPTYAGRNRANPGAMILTGQMMLRFIGWDEAAECVFKGVEKTIRQKKVTEDLARMMNGVVPIACSGFGDAVVENIKSL